MAKLKSPILINRTTFKRVGGGSSLLLSLLDYSDSYGYLVMATYGYLVMVT